MKKLFISAIAMLTMLFVINPVYADSHGGSTIIEFIGQSESYNVSVPAKLTPGDSGTVTVFGQWKADSTLVVKTPNTVTMVNVANPLETKELGISFSDIIQPGDDLANINISREISIDDFDSIFGAWHGTLEYTVELQERKFGNSSLWYKIDGTTLKIRATETPGYTERVLHEDPAAAKNGWYANNKDERIIFNSCILITLELSYFCKVIL